MSRNRATRLAITSWTTASATSCASRPIPSSRPSAVRQRRSRLTVSATVVSQRPSTPYSECRSAMTAGPPSSRPRRRSLHFLDSASLRGRAPAPDTRAASRSSDLHQLLDRRASRSHESRDPLRPERQLRPAVPEDRVRAPRHPTTGGIAAGEVVAAPSPTRSASEIQVVQRGSQRLLGRGPHHGDRPHGARPDPVGLLDPQCASDHHPNLFLVGAGVFPTAGTANPTLTLAVLVLRLPRIPSIGASRLRCGI